MKLARKYDIRRSDIIVALYVFLVVVSEVFGAKTFTLFNIGSFSLSASVAIFVLPFVLLHIRHHAESSWSRTRPRISPHRHRDHRPTHALRSASN